MKRIFSNKSAVKQSLLLTTFIALSVWAGSILLSPEHKRSSVPVTTSTTTPNNQIQAGQPQVYWLRLRSTHATRTSQNKLTLVAKSLPSNTPGSTPQQVLTTAITKLLAAQPSDNLSSTIPKGTKLRSLQVKSDGVHIDLSREFRAGGGSTSMIYRVAQMIYTATSLDPNQKVFLSVEGQSILQRRGYANDKEHPLGGEGLILRQPITRSQFDADFPLNS